MKGKIAAAALLAVFLSGIARSEGEKPAADTPADKAEDEARAKAAGLDLDVLAKLAKFEQLKQDRIDKLKKKRAPKSQIERIAAEPITVGDLGVPLEVGAIGDLSMTAITVFNVVDKKNFLASVADLHAPPAGTIRTSRRPPVGARQDAWFRGFDTSSMRDDSMFEWEGVVRVTGTKQYETESGGSRTVVVIERFSIEPYYEELKKRGGVAHDSGETIKAAAKPAEKPAADPEKAAESKFKVAEQFLKAGKRESYRATLKDLVTKYPDTKAAEKARQALK